MSQIAYLECPTGIAGDMCLGALVDLGVPLGYLEEQLEGLKIAHEYHLWSEQMERNGQIGTKVHVDLLEKPGESPENHHHHHHVRHLSEIETMIRNAALPPRAEDWSLKVFQNLAVAEGAVHGLAPGKVHFHEVGATDALVDIVGTCLGLDWLDINELYCSPLPTGGGTAQTSHGKLPVPVPAVLKLWETREVPIYSNGIFKELVTPTGAAIATTLAQDFIAAPAMNLQKVGLGAGTAQLPLPNFLRLWLGSKPSTPLYPQETIAVLETQIDDLNPQIVGYVFEELLQVGALDVFSQGIGMKKSRPGILLTVICPPGKISTCQEILFRETTTLGIRYYLQQRSILLREIQTVEIPYGRVRIKVASQGSDGKKKIVNVQPEYEDCAQLARIEGQPWRVVHQLALDAWYEQESRKNFSSQ